MKLIIFLLFSFVCMFTIIVAILRVKLMALINCWSHAELYIQNIYFAITIQAVAGNADNMWFVSMVKDHHCFDCHLQYSPNSTCCITSRH